MDTCRNESLPPPKKTHQIQGEKKKRKRKRKRRQQKDIDSTPLATNKNDETKASKFGKKKDAEPSITNENLTNPIGETVLDKNASIATESNTKRNKPAKPRIKASVKKTIEELETNGNTKIENNDNSNDKKMGEKGWWDR